LDDVVYIHIHNHIHINHGFGGLGGGNKELVAAKHDKFTKSLAFSFIDGTTCASTKVGKLSLLSRIQILVDNFLENNNIFNIRVSTDKCFESSFGSIRAKMAEIESIEVLELLYTRIFTFNIDDKAFVLVY
jgi:hypothetical protein